MNLRETGKYIKSLFKTAPSQYEGPAKLGEIPDIRYGFLPPQHMNQTQMTIVVQANEREYEIPLVKGRLDDPNLQQRNTNIDELRRQAEQPGTTIYVRGEIKRQWTGRSLGWSISRDAYKGTIEINNQPTYTYDVDLDKPIRDHKLEKIVFENAD